MRGHLVLYRGLPGSGKTTRARDYVAADPGNRVRLNRDDVRDMLWGGWTGDRRHEEQITALTAMMLRSLLELGWTVVCDDTNMRNAYIERQCEIAVGVGATVDIVDLTAVPVDVCIRRDAQRGAAAVGADVIRRMHATWLRENGAQIRTPEETS